MYIREELNGNIFKMELIDAALSCIGIKNESVIRRRINKVIRKYEPLIFKDTETLNRIQHEYEYWQNIATTLKTKCITFQEEDPGGIVHIPFKSISRITFFEDPMLNILIITNSGAKIYLSPGDYSFLKYIFKD